MDKGCAWLAGGLLMPLLLGACAQPNHADASDGNGPAPASVAPAPTEASTTAAPESIAGPVAGSPTPAHSQPDLLPPLGGIIGNLGLKDQAGDGTRLHLSAEIDGAPGWVVVQADRSGTPGRVIGLAHRGDGVHDDVVTVRLSPQKATVRLWVTVYVDSGRQGVFESPGPDKPVQFAGRDLRRPVTLTVTPR